MSDPGSQLTLVVDTASWTPARRPSSVRRTTTHDSLRPQGLLGPVTLVARGRDLATDGTGAATVLDEARIDAEVAFPERTITRIALEPAHEGVQGLVGVAVAMGFRRAVHEAMPGERTSRSVRFQLLDDLPTALLVSGYAVQAGGARPEQPRNLPMIHQADMCAGWVAGGTAADGLALEGSPPFRRGPQAPSLAPVDDPLGWHEVDALPAQGMRRRRRLDVWADDGVAMVDAFFRDSYQGVDGVETIVHEYSIRATVDLGTRLVTSCEAGIGALPYFECEGAAASARRIEGAPVDELRRWVRERFVGPSTCTHLNDTMRSLEDVGDLVTALQEIVD